jgi:hypothetical protein
MDFSSKDSLSFMDPELDYRMRRAGEGTQNVEYSDEAANRVFLYIALRVPLARFKDIEGMPDETTVIQWLMERPSFEEKFYQAREVGMAGVSDEILALADSLTHAYYTDFRGKRKVDLARIRQVEIQIDIRKWLMERLASRRFSSRQKIDVTNRNLQSEKGEELLAAFKEAAKKAQDLLMDQRQAMNGLLINPDGTPANHPQSDAFALDVISNRKGEET